MKMDEIENLYKSAKSGVKEKQVTRGHNIVANGWTGAHNPLLTHRQTHTTAVFQICGFYTFYLITTDLWTNGRADEQSLS